MTNSRPCGGRFSFLALFGLAMLHAYWNLFLQWESTIPCSCDTNGSVYHVGRLGPFRVTHWELARVMMFPRIMVVFYQDPLRNGSMAMCPAFLPIPLGFCPESSAPRITVTQRDENRREYRGWNTFTYCSQRSQQATRYCGSHL